MVRSVLPFEKSDFLLEDGFLEASRSILAQRFENFWVDLACAII